jgi:hypothetical protein
MRAIDVVVRELCLAVAEGRQARQDKGLSDAPAQPAGGDRGERPERGDKGDGGRRSRRPSSRADEIAANN